MDTFWEQLLEDEDHCKASDDTKIERERERERPTIHFWSLYCSHPFSFFFFLPSSLSEYCTETLYELPNASLTSFHGTPSPSLIDGKKIILMFQSSNFFHVQSQAIPKYGLHLVPQKGNQ